MRGGAVGNAHYWDRALSDGEVLQEYINPFQIYEPAPLRIYWPGAAPSGFQPAWARGSNVIIGGATA
jgi:hypothetical protein